MKDNFTKSDLKSGMFVILRCGDKCVVQEEHKIFVDIKDGSYLSFYNIKNDLSNINSNVLDIIKVYEDYTCQKLLWQRKTNMRPTEDEKTILKNLHEGFEWIARDEDSCLCIYDKKPEKGIDYWQCTHTFEELEFFNHLFTFIKWEDEEPYLISDLLGGENNEN